MRDDLDQEVQRLRGVLTDPESYRGLQALLTDWENAWRKQAETRALEHVHRTDSADDGARVDSLKLLGRAEAARRLHTLLTRLREGK